MKTDVTNDERFNMTLAEWQAESGSWIGEHKSGAKWIPANMPIPLHWELYHLRDWVISSYTGGSIWLVKREVSK